VKSSVLCLSFALVLLAGCSERGVGGPVRHPAACPALAVHGEPVPRSTIFVLADTLRRDRLGVHGGPARTPAFDRLAAEGVRFTSVSSQAPWTKPSIATLFTGLYPSQHGVVGHPQLHSKAGAEPSSEVLAPEHVTLAEALSAAGWRTAAFVSNPWLRASFGFAQGFDAWNESFAADDTPGTVVTRAGLAWLREVPNDGRPYFLYLHYMDAHEPYHPIPAARLAERRQAIEADTRPVTQIAMNAIIHRALDEAGKRVAWNGVIPNVALMELVYDQGVEAFDAALGELLTGLEQIPGARDAMVVVTSDHGQALYQRGWAGHGHGFFDDEIGVPLVVRSPGLSADAPVDCPLGLIDLRSTLCDLLAVDCGGPDQGRSLLAREVPPESFVLSEGVVLRPRHRAARDQRFKLIYEPDGRLPYGALQPHDAFSLYDLAADPQERRDLLAQPEAPEAAATFARLRHGLESGIRELGLPPPEQAPLDPATRRRLEALGYVEDGQER
jgi:arylsulfatase A-like enzyme